MTTKLVLTASAPLADRPYTTVQFWLAGIVVDPVGAAPAALTSALQGICDLALVNATVVPADETDVGAASQGAYDDAEDKLLIVGLGAAGETMKIEIPAPLETIFLADKVTPDPANALWMAVEAELETNWKTTNGGAVEVVSARRIRKRAMKE